MQTLRASFSWCIMLKSNEHVDPCSSWLSTCNILFVQIWPRFKMSVALLHDHPWTTSIWLDSRQTERTLSPGTLEADEDGAAAEDPTCLFSWCIPGTVCAATGLVQYLHLRTKMMGAKLNANRPTCRQVASPALIIRVHIVPDPGLMPK